MLKVIGSVRSRTFRVLWALEEMEVPFEHVAAGPHSEEVTRLNPSGKVPVVVEEDRVLTDSSAILLHLADRNGKLTFPAGSAARAYQDAAMFFVLDEIEGPLWTAAKHSFVLPEERRVPEIKPTLRWEFARAVDRLADRIGAGPFLMGETMTVADIVATHCGTWADAADFPVENATVTAYFDRMRARPKFKEVAALLT